MLLAWYPLNGNLEDYSGNGNHLVNNNTTNITVNSSGKIGKCYNFTGTSYLSSNSSISPLKEVTYTAWINWTNSTVYCQGVVNNFRHGGSSGYNSSFNICSTGQLRLDIAQKDGTTHTALMSTGKISENVWSHVACYLNYETGECKFYINGKLDTTTRFSSSYYPMKTQSEKIMIGQWGWSYASAYKFIGKINDVRIYDEALSLKEIKEIAKAKILHYNFNHSAESTENIVKYQDLVTNSNIVNNYGWDKTLHSKAIQVQDWGVGYNGGVTSPSIGYHAHWILDTSTQKPIMRFPNLNNSDGLTLGYRWLGITCELPASKFSPNVSYTISWEQKVDEINQGAWIGVYHRKTDSTSYGFHSGISSSKVNSAINKWERKSYTFTMSSLYDSNYNPKVYVYGNRSSGQGNLYVRNVQIEAKNHVTDFIEGGKTRIDRVSDCSGFRNHSAPLNLIETPQWYGNGLLGSGCYKFNNATKTSTGNYQHFKSKETIRIPEQGTISFYIKHEGTANSDNKYAVGFQNFCSMNNNGLIGLIYYYDGSNYTTRTASCNFYDGNWHMYTITWDSVAKNVKLYKDGVKQYDGSVTAFYHVGSFRYFLVGNAWGTAYGGHSGYLDDVRLYATALSDEYVKELYQSRGSIAKNGKLIVNEIVEHDNLFNPKLILDRQKELGINSNSKIVKKDDGTECLAISASSFYKGGVYYSIFPSNYFKENTSYEFDLMMNGNLIYQGNEVPFGFDIYYTDGSKYTFNHKTSGTWKKCVYTTPSNKTIEKVGVYYYIGDLFYCDIKNCSITEVMDSQKINKRGQLITKEIIEYPSVNLETKTAYGADWVQLFYHNNKSSTVLFSSDKKEFLKCNTDDKISNLYLMELFRGKDGKFELLLEYQSGGTSYNRWKQASNFTTEPIVGYEAIQCSWTSNSWMGLAPSSSASQTWVDGSPKADTWHYAIGSKAKWNEGIPGPTSAEIGWVKIWVRCDNPSVFKMYKNGNTSATEFIEN